MTAIDLDPDAYDRWKDDQQERLAPKPCGCQPWRNDLGVVVILQCVDHAFLASDDLYQAELDAEALEIAAAAEAVERDAQWRYDCPDCGRLVHRRGELCRKCEAGL